MYRIISHLENLLLLNDCVIVPRLGGFVLHDVPASYDGKTHFFRPMRKDVVFNPTLRYNDGLLAESYMKTYDIDYQKAYRLVENDVKELKSLIRENREFSFGTVGLFRLGDEGQIVFTPADAGFQRLDSYGLPAFRLHTVQSLEQEMDMLLNGSRKKKNDAVFYIPVNRQWIKGIAGVAAAVALFFVISTPVRQMDMNTYTASFVPVAEVVSTGRLSASAPVATKEKEKIVVPVRMKVERPAPKRLYYVIVSSLTSEKQADKFIAETNRNEFKKIGKLIESNKVRVYAERFDDRKQADVYLAKLRTIPQYRDAWIYIP